MCSKSIRSKGMYITDAEDKPIVIYFSRFRIYHLIKLDRSKQTNTHTGII